MNDMDETMGAVRSSGGVSRRDMIKASVVAGALVWSAPILLTGKAAAAPGDPCCPNGTPVSINIPEKGGVNCGAVQCLDNVLIGFPNGADFPCTSDLTNCINEQRLVVGDFQGGGTDEATIILAAGVTLIVGTVKTGSDCFYTRCNPNGPFDSGHSTSVDDGVNPNICEAQNEGPCDSIDPPLPPAPTGRNRIFITPGPMGTTIVHVDQSSDPLGQVELSICVAPEVTALCG
jgi:hypothetical protein